VKPLPPKMHSAGSPQPRKAGLIYRIVKWYCRVTLPFYFSRWQVNGQGHVPSGPVILVANHRNAFLDAILVACSSRRNPWFITRADVFRKPMVQRMLSVLRMLPVYRFRDGFGSMKQNGHAISRCVDLLNRGESILIFAEGNHGTHHRIRKLQKGVVKITGSPELQCEPAVVPVGLYYESLTAFRSRVLVQFGQPVFPGKDELIGEKLLEVLSDSLKNLTLHIEGDRYDEKLNFIKSHRTVYHDMTLQLGHDRELLHRFDVHDESEAFHKTPKSNSVIRLWIKINLMMAAFAVDRFILSRIEDPQFVGSVRFSAGMVMVPAALMIQCAIMYSITGSPAAVFVYLIVVIAAIRFYSRNILD
jgi:1-acyl-sn-glycerol-3-phosphate acyltransferase